MSTTMTVRLDEDLKQRLDQLADSTHRSKSFLAAEAIRAFVESDEWQIGEIRAALAEADSGDFASEEELGYIAQDDPAAARLVARRILDAVAMLAEQPGLGRPGRVAGTRELVVLKTRYLLPYRVRNDSVEILRISHSSQRLPRR